MSQSYSTYSMNLPSVSHPPPRPVLNEPTCWVDCTHPRVVNMDCLEVGPPISCHASPSPFCLKELFSKLSEEIVLAAESRGLFFCIHSFWPIMLKWQQLMHGHLHASNQLCSTWWRGSLPGLAEHGRPLLLTAHALKLPPHGVLARVLRRRYHQNQFPAFDQSHSVKKLRL